MLRIHDYTRFCHHKVNETVLWHHKTSDTLLLLAFNDVQIEWVAGVGRAQPAPSQGLRSVYHGIRLYLLPATPAVLKAEKIVWTPKSI